MLASQNLTSQLVLTTSEHHTTKILIGHQSVTIPIKAPDDSSTLSDWDAANLLFSKELLEVVRADSLAILVIEPAEGRVGLEVRDVTEGVSLLFYYYFCFADCVEKLLE